MKAVFRWFVTTLLSSLPWLVVAFILGILVLLRFPLDSLRRFDLALDGNSSWFYPFLPAERVTPPGRQTGGWLGQQIIADPVYATARLPGMFDRVTLELEARTERQPLIELGLAKDVRGNDYDLQPVWSQVLQQGWLPLRLADFQGYVRRQALGSVGHEPLPADRLLTWHASTTLAEPMDGIGTMRSVFVSLRGPHDLYLIPTNGDLFLRLVIQDMNRVDGEDEMKFILTHGDEVIWNDLYSTAGDSHHRPTPTYEKTINLHHLPAGIYHLALVTTDNFFIRQITTSAKHWVIGPSIFFGDTVGIAPTAVQTSAWTNARDALAQTLHDDGLQQVSLGQTTATLMEAHRNAALHRAPGDRGGNRLFATQRGDVRVVGDGYFSFFPDALFLPAPRRLSDQSVPAEEGVAAIVTNYQPPEQTADGWLRLKASFPIPPQATALKFVLSAPGIESRQGKIDIRRVRLSYQRPALNRSTFQTYIWREIINAWHQL